MIDDIALESHRNYHLAGVVPVAGPRLDFNFPWHDCLQPIALDYLAVERSVVECAYAGCETIWVVCNDDMQRLIKKRMGDFIEDPYFLAKHKFVKYPSEHRRQIPIFYTPIHPKDRDRRDSYGWSALHGALTAFIVSSKISKWLKPNRYYVSFPYGVYDPSVVATERKRISSKKPFFLSCHGKTIRDGEYLGFTMNASEYNKYLWNVKNKCTGGSKSVTREKRWSSRHFSLDEIFDCAIIDESCERKIEWYYSIDSWDKYVGFIASPHSKTIKKPCAKMFSYHEYNKVLFEGGRSERD